MTREIVWTIIQWAPFFEQKNKPKSKSDIMELSIDKQVHERVKKVKKITESELMKMRDHLAKGIKQ